MSNRTPAERRRYRWHSLRRGRAFPIRFYSVLFSSIQHGSGISVGNGQSFATVNGHEFTRILDRGPESIRIKSTITSRNSPKMRPFSWVMSVNLCRRTTNKFTLAFRSHFGRIWVAFCAEAEALRRPGGKEARRRWFASGVSRTIGTFRAVRQAVTSWSRSFLCHGCRSHVTTEHRSVQLFFCTKEARMLSRTGV
jgi:hypothetical protein